jgi:hypothetical protein
MAKRSSPRLPRAERASGIPLVIKIVGGVVGALIGVHFYLMHQINQFADSLVRSAEMVSIASHRGGYYTWDGNLGIRRLRFESPDGGALFSAAETELDTPGWWWVLQLANPLESRTDRLRRAFSAFGGSDGKTDLLPATNQLYVRLRGLELEINPLMPAGMPDISFASAAPFETAGCSNVRYFVPLNLERDLGLAYSRTDLSLGYRAEGPDRVVVEMDLNAQGSMSTRFEMDWRSSRPNHFLDSNDSNDRPLAMRWVLQDQGFISARNRWCAKEAEIDADEFQRRHITTVRRLLEVFGVQLSPESEAAYSSFAAKGGRLTIELKPPAPADAEQFAAYSAEERWTAMDPKIWHNNEPRSAFTVDLVRARPLPKAYGGSVYDLLARQEDNAAAIAGFSPMASIGAQLSSLSQPQSNAVEPPPASEASAAPKPFAGRPPPPKPTPIALDSASLIAAIGERVAIETIDGRSRIGVLTEVNPKVLTIQMNVSGGKASLNFTRSRIRAVIANPDGR